MLNDGRRWQGIHEKDLNVVHRFPSSADAKNGEILDREDACDGPERPWLRKVHGRVGSSAHCWNWVVFPKSPDRDGIVTAATQKGIHLAVHGLPVNSGVSGPGVLGTAKGQCEHSE